METVTYPHIVKPTGGPAHLERWPRVRVVLIVADHLGNGWSAEEILRQYPYLHPSEIHSALAYYFDHPNEIDVELEEEIAALDAEAAGPASSLRIRLLAARRQSAA